MLALAALGAGAATAAVADSAAVPTMQNPKDRLAVPLHNDNLRKGHLCSPGRFEGLVLPAEHCSASLD